MMQRFWIIMRGLYIFLFSIVVSLLDAMPAVAASSDDILGAWNNEGQTARIEVFRCGDRYCGKIIWLREQNYPADSRDGTPGFPKRDHNNPDPAKRNEPLLGLTIVHGMQPDGDGAWSGGTVYDPKNGKTYRGKMTLAAPDRLALRGYVGISLLGRTSAWPRNRASFVTEEK